MKNKKRLRRWHIVWLVCSLVLVALLGYQLNARFARVSVIVAKHNFAPGDLIRPNEADIELKDVAPDTVELGRLLLPGTLPPDGGRVLEAIGAGELVLERHVARVDPTDGKIKVVTRASGRIASAGHRLISWPINRGGAQGGFFSRVQANDKIDLIITVRDPVSKDEVTKVIRQGVPIIELTGGDMLFEVTTQEAEEMVFAQSNGTISFALAPVNAITCATTGTSFATFRRRYLGTIPSANTTPSPAAQPAGTRTPTAATPTPVTSPTRVAPTPTLNPACGFDTVDEAAPGSRAPSGTPSPGATTPAPAATVPAPVGR